MGGCIALTIRFTGTDTYRGSCWTNALPDGLWTAPFYIDIDTSRVHAKTWLTHRATDPDLEAMCDDWNMLAPLEYGLVLIDYVTSTLISAQGYSSPNSIFRPKDARPHTHDLFGNKIATWDALSLAQLLTESPRPGPPSMLHADIKMPFKNVLVTDEHDVTPEMQAWVEKTYGLSDAEKTAWGEWFTDHEYRMAQVEF